MFLSKVTSFASNARQQLLTRLPTSLNRPFSSSSTPSPALDQYSRPVRVLHLLSGAGMLGCIASGYKASTINPKTATPEEKKLKGDLMFYHKSFGLLVAGLMIPRVAIRILSRQPNPIPGGYFWEKPAASITHLALYGGIIALPVTGVGMGYFNGFGIPFFGIAKFPGADKEHVDKQRAGFLFKWHKRIGQAMEYLVPLHVGATVFHRVVHGTSIISRINPFVTNAVTK